MSYMVAVCDILGFTELVEKNPVDLVVHRSFERLRKSLDHSLNQNGSPTDTPSLSQLQAHGQL